MSERMTESEAAKMYSQTKTWTQKFRGLCAMVDEAEGGLEAQVEQTRSTAPAVYAAFHLLGFLLQYQLIEATRHGEDGIIHLLPPRLLRAVADSPLVISREHYCQILDQSAAARHFRELARGRLTEPSPGCHAN